MGEDLELEKDHGWHLNILEETQRAILHSRCITRQVKKTQAKPTKFQTYLVLHLP